jgi:hypothetical protein
MPIFEPPVMGYLQKPIVKEQLLGGKNKRCSKNKKNTKVK